MRIWTAPIQLPRLSHGAATRWTHPGGFEEQNKLQEGGKIRTSSNMGIEDLTGFPLVFRSQGPYNIVVRFDCLLCLVRRCLVADLIRVQDKD